MVIKSRQKPACPLCGSTICRTAPIKETDVLVIVRDRICCDCGNRYTPPVPVWTPVGLFVAGVSLVAFFAGMLYDSLVTRLVLDEHIQFSVIGIFGCIGGTILGVCLAIHGIIQARKVWFSRY